MLFKTKLMVLAIVSILGILVNMYAIVLELQLMRSPYLSATKVGLCMFINLCALGYSIYALIAAWGLLAKLRQLSE